MGTLFYILLVVFITFFEVFRRKYFKVDALTFFHVFFMLSYLMPGLAWSIYPDSELWNRYSFKYNPSQQAIVVFSIFLAYFSVFLAFITFSKYKSKYYLSIELRSKTVFLYYIYAILILSLIVISIYSAGGFEFFLRQAIAHRHREPSYGVGTYLKYFIFPAVIVMLGLFLMAKRTKGFIKLFLIVFNFVFVFLTVVFIISTGGRSNLIILFLLTTMLCFALSQRVSLRLLFLFFLGVFISLLIMNYYREITFLWSKGGLEFDEIELDKNSDTIVFLLGIFSYFQHYFYSIFEALYNSEVYNYPRLGLDWVRVFFAMIPGVQISDLDVFHVSLAPDIISIYHFDRGPGYIPPGWIALSLMNGGFLWLAVKSLLIGFTASFLSNKNYKSVSKDPIVVFFYFVVFFLWERLMIINESLNTGSNYLGYYFFIIILPFIVKISFKRAG